MSEHNFNSFKNLEVPDSWVEGALNVEPEVDEKNGISFPKIATIAACFTLIIALSIFAFVLFRNHENTDIFNTEQTNTSSQNSAVDPDLFPAKSDTFVPPQDHTQNFSTNENGPTTANNLCIVEFSSDLLVGDGNIYCVLYDYKTGELMGDENLLANEHLAQVEDLGDGMVKATYAPLDKGVVKKSGEYWYVFYNELIMSPVQNYIYIHK